MPTVPGSGSVGRVLLTVSADDCTGALESAALCADAGWRTTMTASTVDPVPAPVGTATCVVVDLRSRHLTGAEAAARLAAVARRRGHRAHKIDSTLRGNWADELTAAAAGGSRVVLIPAYPEAGRACRGGVVLEHGVPVDRTAHGRDPRSPSRTSRPASLLPGAVELSGAAELRAWLAAGDGRVAVVDATTRADVDELVAASLAHDDVLVAGPAAVIGAVARTHPAAPRPSVPRTRAARLVRPVLVVVGSAHPASHAQVDALAAAGVPVVEPTPTGDAGVPDAPVLVLAAPPERGDAHAGASGALATAARQLVRSGRVATVVVVGGDTAEAVIGDALVSVHGSLGVGIALASVRLEGHELALVTKPGGFGGPATLVDLMSPMSDSPTVELDSLR